MEIDPDTTKASSPPAITTTTTSSSSSIPLSSAQFHLILPPTLQPRPSFSVSHLQSRPALSASPLEDPSRRLPPLPEPVSHLPLYPHFASISGGPGISFPSPPTPASVSAPTDSDPSPAPDLASAFVPSPTPTPTPASRTEKLLDQKRTRACESCRGLKVRCDPNPGDPFGTCKRCAKASRACIFTVPSRKRQKKADSKVAELERKIDALTASLEATRQKAALGSDNEDGSAEGGLANADSVVLQSPASTRLAKRRRVGGDEDAPKYFGSYPFLATPVSETREGTYPSPEDSKMHNSGILDVIDREILGMDMAQKIFNHYVEDLVPHFPAVVFPPGTTADQVRKDTPTLFLAILAAASATTTPGLHKVLHGEISRLLADRVMVSGQKSMELVQSLLVSSVWYYPPDRFDEVKGYMLIHQAAVMALEIGLAVKKLPPRVGALGLGAGQPGESGSKGTRPNTPPGPPLSFQPPPDAQKYGFTKPLPLPLPQVPYPDSSAIESRRTLLGCYWMSSNTALALRKPNLLRFTRFMQECVEDLERNPKAVGTDRNLCQWVRMQMIAEEVGNEFAFGDAEGATLMEDSRVQCLLEEFATRLLQWRSNLTAEAVHPHLELVYHVAMLYTNEIVLHREHNMDDFKPPFFESNIRAAPPQTRLIPYQISAITTCVSSSHAVLNTFLDLSISAARAIPMFSFVRCSYVCIVLLKIYFSIPTDVIDKSTICIADYLDRMAAKLAVVAQGGKCRAAAKFLMIFNLLKGWYLRQEAELEAPARSFKELDIGDEEEQQNGVEMVEEAAAAAPITPQEGSGQLVFTGTGEMFADDTFWALMDGGIWGLNMLDWGQGLF